MSTRPDRLANPKHDHRDRLNYVQGLLLDASSFGVEQLYHRGRLARALAYLFGTGTVAGLEVTYENDDGEDEILVKPGLAIDPLGRLIEVPTRWCVELGPWFEAQREADLESGWLSTGANTGELIADVFLRFAECPRRLSPALATGPYDALDAVSPSRLRDGFELALVIRPEAGDRREALADGLPDVPEVPLPGANERLETLLGLDPAPRLAAMRDDIKAAWREGSANWEGDRPPRLPEHLDSDVTYEGDDPLEVGRDPTSVLLARASIPVSATLGVDEPPTRPAILTTTVDDDLRRFIYAPGILTQVVEEAP